MNFGFAPLFAEAVLQLTDHDLVSRSREGDPEAFRMLVERYQHRAYGIAMGVLRNPADAMDAAQDAFVKVYKNIQNFKGESAFYTWLYRIVVNVCIDHIRKHKKRRMVEYDDTWRRRDQAEFTPLTGNTRAMQPNIALENEELSLVLNEALSTLSENHRAIILLREVEGLSYEQIAEVMDCHIGTVMSRLHHARKRLQKALKPYLEASGQIDLAQRAGAGVRKRA